MTPMFTMGETTAATGLTADTLRYYEDESIIGPFARDHRNHRVFSEKDIAWIHVVTCMKDAGLGIDELRTFADLLHGTHTAPDPVGFLRERRAALAERRQVLTLAIAVMDEKIAHFASTGTEEGEP
ncbi:DNA-binding transcriptional MerR regulator [Microbacterium sp. SORGH_AS428]|uniref:MerR family transcriptional regulator n=1 Tax=Microbacterium sp. SORGH_AS_0428 TaxID=3041788 RepID=UPI00285650E1|nr:MerR family transcriptional regulator [Microbacterium sp. SORGH_AS_0428]MDR6200218.1 DNA-binding transcriptional MerR regulator [Microbacterium sp. SORGH_AS_0428]